MPLPGKSKNILEDEECWNENQTPDFSRLPWLTEREFYGPEHSSTDEIETSLTVQGTGFNLYSQQLDAIFGYHSFTKGFAPVTKRPCPKSQSKEESSNLCSPRPKRRKEMLPKESTRVLRSWLFAHEEDPYPSKEEKITLSMETGLSIQQIDYWFINARRRILKPYQSKLAQLLQRVE